MSRCPQPRRKGVSNILLSLSTVMLLIVALVSCSESTEREGSGVQSSTAQQASTPTPTQQHEVAPTSEPSPTPQPTQQTSAPPTVVPPSTPQPAQQTSAPPTMVPPSTPQPTQQTSAPPTMVPPPTPSPTQHASATPTLVPSPTPPPARQTPATPTLEPPPTPPPLPTISISHDGNVHWSNPSGYSWPTDYGHATLISEPLTLELLNKEATILVKRGESLLVVVSSSDLNNFEVKAKILPVLELDPMVEFGEAVYSGLAGERITLDLPPAVYRLNAHYESQTGYVIYNFKVEVSN